MPGTLSLPHVSCLVPAGVGLPIGAQQYTPTPLTPHDPGEHSRSQGQPIPASEPMRRQLSASSCSSFSLLSSSSISRTLALMASSSWNSNHSLCKQHVLQTHSPPCAEATGSQARDRGQRPQVKGVQLSAPLVRKTFPSLCLPTKQCCSRGVPEAETPERTRD